MTFVAYAPLDEVTIEVAYVQARVAESVEVMVDNVETVTIDQYLVGIEIAVDTNWRNGNDRFGKSVAMAYNPSNSLFKFGHITSNSRQTFIKTCQVVIERMPFLGRYVDLVQFVGGFGDSSRNPGRPGTG
jgi:hypothetical protein